MKILHGYDPVLWEGYKKHGLIREGDGIRFMQNFLTPDAFRFNNLAKKGGKLYGIIKETKCPFYIDRLQGGAIIYDYDYDEELLDEYKEMLGDDFLGFQMHEWLSNYRSDLNKCKDIPDDQWNEENITVAIKKVFPCKNLFLEAMTMEEMLAHGRPKTAKAFYDNMTGIYKKRLEKYKRLVPCDSGYIMYPFEAQNGAKVIMPEVGACSYSGVIFMMSFARGVTKGYGIKLGAYYEPWGGKPFSVCTYFPNDKNDWFIDDTEEFPFRFMGANGGSSRSGQFRVCLYAYLSGADYLSEEWGGFNTFEDAECNTLSEYGKVKKKLVDFMDKYPDVGEKLAPIAVVLPDSLPTYVVGKKSGTSGDDDGELYQFPLSEQESENLIFVKSNIDKIFFKAESMSGNETNGLINTTVPDAVDVLNAGVGESAIQNYQYIVDLTGDEAFAKSHKNIIKAENAEVVLNEILPCRIEGGLHHFINHKIGGGYYLTVFNNSGVVRTVAEGDVKLPEAETTVKITMNKGFKASELKLLEGDGVFEKNGDTYCVTVPAGGYMFMEF